MSIDPKVSRSRRSVLSAAAATAAGIAVGALAKPEPAAAAQYNLQAEAINTTTAGTTIAGGYFNTLTVSANGGGACAFTAIATSNANAITATADGYDAVHCSASTGRGVNAYSGSGYGVDGAADTGIGVRGATNTGTGVVGQVGLSDPATPLGVALYGSVSLPTQTGIRAEGRIVLPDRSGRKLIPRNAASVSFTVPGVTAGNFAIATLSTRRAGRWVIAAVCSTNKLTIYLNLALGTATYVSWIVIG